MKTRRHVLAGAAALAILPTVAAATVPAAPPPGRILLIEDEEAVCRVAARLLRARGYDVAEAISADEAEHVARDHGRVFDLVICDSLIGETVGADLVSSLRHWVGAVPVMYISSYDLRDFPGDGWEGEGTSFHLKPLSIAELDGAARAAIAEQVERVKARDAAWAAAGL